MYSKISSTWALCAVCLVGILFSALIILSAPNVLAGSGAGLPVRLQIPKINVDAVIESVGLTKDGAMVAPETPGNAAWYDLGPKPGEIGNAVIDGHSGWKNDIPAIFDTLHALHKGDKIFVTDTAGILTVFTVSEIRTYNPDADASGVFRSSDGKAHLNLITCAGVWNEATKNSSKRLVVFADMQF